MALGLRLVQQYGRALESAEQGRAELEVRIREATAQIEKNFAQLSEMKVEQVTDRERKRIAADLHDDLGAKLLTIVHTSDSERISTLDLPEDVLAPAEASAEPHTPSALREFRDKTERDFIIATLKRCGGNISQSAIELGVGRTYLHKRLAVLGIAKKDWLV